MILFADYNAPYLFAISFVLLIGLLEIIAIICGHMLSGALDAHLDHYDSITTGNISQALHYLEYRKVASPRRRPLPASRFLWAAWCFATTRLHLALASPTLESVRCSCQFTALNYHGALYR